MDCFTMKGDSQYSLLPELEELIEEASAEHKSHRKHKKKVICYLKAVVVLV